MPTPTSEESAVGVRERVYYFVLGGFHAFLSFTQLEGENQRDGEEV